MCIKNHVITTKNGNSNVKRINKINQVFSKKNKKIKANLFCNPKIFYATPFGVATHSLRSPDLKHHDYDFIEKKFYPEAKTML